MKFPGVVAVLCVVPSGLVLHIGITSCTFPPWTEMSKKNRYGMVVVASHTECEITDYLVCTANAHARVSCILWQFAPARTLWKNTRLIKP